MFKAVDNKVDFPALEARILEFWREHGIYEKSLEQRRGAPRFVFYEGPPTANGLPHPGHCLTRAIKDLFPRYRTMRGQFCERKGGWDTHGLPVEVEVCKELGIHSKEEIEAYGVEPFIHKCLESVFRYTREWEQMTERLGFWIHLDEAYVTYHQSYIESVWWALKQLFDRGLLYQGHKIVWWWAQGGTALSSGEVGQGYREVADPSVYVRFPLVEPPPGVAGEVDLLVWTTTPWTLPSNQFVAVDPELPYAVVRVGDEARQLIIAEALVAEIGERSKQNLEVVKTLRGADLLDLRYQPPFDYFYTHDGKRTGKLRDGGRQHIAWRVLAADFVTTDSGTGLVHQAPAFGEVDYDVLLREQARFEEGEGPPLICPVAPDGTFTKEVSDFVGRWVKEADKDLTRQLRQSGRLFHQDQYLHDYPFCWRSEEDPLIQYPRQSWFVRTTKFRDEMLVNNRQINWLPAHIRDGRFGNFLESNVDWALSRERFWGTPLPIWHCPETGDVEAVASYEELLAKPGVAGTEVWDKALAENPDLSPHLRIHKPYIDEVTYDAPSDPKHRMRRVTEVIDCWFDSGAMPFAQWGYPQQGKELFEQQFPADFISEAIDQTRGWFYSQLAISTLLFGNSEESNRDPLSARYRYPHPFRNCIVLGLMLGEDGGKMSKSKRNYREPNEIFDRYGADALRWYFFANQPPWTGIRYSERAIKESIPEFLLRLWNVYSFMVIYASIDGFDPGELLPGDAGQLHADALAAATHYRPVAVRSELDRWLISELNRTIRFVTERMDEYDNYTACGHLTAFVDALSNWYVRRSRDRFWSGEKSADKWDAYWTLYECLIATSKLIAPFIPFLAESLWQNLARGPLAGRVAESVHLCDYPTSESSLEDEQLSVRMALVREIVSSGRSARMGAKLKVRQPLAKVEVILADDTHQPWLAEHVGLIAEELNVKDVEFTDHAEQYIDYTVLPDLKRLGPRLGKQIPALRKALAEADPAQLVREMDTAGQVVVDLPDGELTLEPDDLQLRLNAKPGWAAAQGPSGVVVLATELTDELRAEGSARDLVHTIQNRRKELECEYTDRIQVGLTTDDAELRSSLESFAEYIRGETLATEFNFAALPDVEGTPLKLDEAELTLYVAIDREASPSSC